jgi:hypothetical protein
LVGRNPPSRDCFSAGQGAIPVVVFRVSLDVLRQTGRCVI